MLSYFRLHRKWRVREISEKNNKWLLNMKELDLEKCKSCKEFKCIIAKSLFNTELEIRILDMKRQKIQELKDSYRFQAEIIEKNFDKILSKTTINTLEIIYKKEHELAMEYINL